MSTVIIEMAEVTPKNQKKQLADLQYWGRLQWFHWCILALSMLITIGAWSFAKFQVDKNNTEQFDAAASQIVELVSDRLDKYELALWGGVAAIKANGDSVNRAEWRTFADNLKIDLRYPGIKGVGVINRLKPEQLEEFVAEQRRDFPDFRVYPSHSENEFWPITYIEPQAGNLAALGLDMAHEENRFNAARSARDEGVAKITGPITLVQEGSAPGFLLFVPLYKDGAISTIESRRENFIGLVYAPFVMNTLLEGLRELNNRQVSIQIQDGDKMLFDDSMRDRARDESLFQKEIKVNEHGRTWTFSIWSSARFDELASNSQPLLILIAGLIVEILLLTLFVMLSNTNRRALALADLMTMEYKANAAELKRSNDELESFAYVASHDLKTPLRGISDLASYLEEDLEEYLASPDVNPDVPYNIKRIVQQVGRMEYLIKGVLDYAGIGLRKEELVEIATAQIISDIRALHDPQGDRLRVSGEFPVMTTYAGRFEQVLANLVANAFRYHHAPEKAIVTVSVRELGEFYEFSVADNGPGIDPKFHAKIFEVFQSLQSRDTVESSGVGLAVVKKSVESLGGTVSVFSKAGAGATFKFLWPKVIGDKNRLGQQDSTNGSGKR